MQQPKITAQDQSSSSSERKTTLNVRATLYSPNTDFWLERTKKKRCNANKTNKSKDSFPAAHQRPGLWSELKPDTSWKKKQDDKCFCHLIQTKQMKGKLFKSPRVTGEHEMIFSCWFDGLDNARWQWMGRTPNREHTQVWRGCFVCLHKDKEAAFLSFFFPALKKEDSFSFCARLVLFTLSMNESHLSAYSNIERGSKQNTSASDITFV